MRKHKGFSLIELLIVIAIMLILSAIAIPNLLRARIAANESSAVATVRSINTAQVTYASTYVNTGYTILAQLGGANPCVPSALTSCLIDSTVSVAPFTKSGFVFAAGPVGAAPAIQFTVNSDPTTWAQTGSRHFFSDESAVIRFNIANAPATVVNPPLN